jgi:hypothetical protein
MALSVYLALSGAGGGVAVGVSVGEVGMSTISVGGTSVGKSWMVIVCAGTGVEAPQETRIIVRKNNGNAWVTFRIAIF